MSEESSTPPLPFTCTHIPRMWSLVSHTERTRCELCGVLLVYNNLIEPGPNRWEPVYE